VGLVWSPDQAKCIIPGCEGSGVQQIRRFLQRLVFFAAFAVKDLTAKLAKDAKKKARPNVKPRIAPSLLTIFPGRANFFSE
jgi:hypothetical protein